MAGEPAIRKVLERTRAWLDGQLGSGVAIHIDRPFDRPFRDDDLPCVNLRCPMVTFSHHNFTGGFLHDGEVAFDIAAPSSATSGIGADQAEIAARLTARMAARTATAGTIGEALQDCYPLSMGVPQDEFLLADHGVTVFAWRFTWLTPLADFRTIIGHLGPIA